MRRVISQIFQYIAFKISKIETNNFGGQNTLILFYFNVYLLNDSKKIHLSYFKLSLPFSISFEMLSNNICPLNKLNVIPLKNNWKPTGK